MIVGMAALALIAFAANSVLCRMALLDGSIAPALFTAIRVISGAVTLVILMALRGGRPMQAWPNWAAGASLFVYMAFFSFAYIALGAGTGALVLFGFVQLTMISVANGIMENAVNRFIEMSALPEAEQRPVAIERFEKKILRSISWIENKFDEFAKKEISMDQIAVACALDYTSLRLSSEWKKQNPKLTEWLELITENGYMKNTLPGESFKYE
jgi:hypothetical protein